MSCGKYDVISLYFWCCSVNGFVCLVCLTVWNVMEVSSVGRGALLDRPCWSSKECACCTCNPSVHLSVLSIGFVNDLY